MLILACSTVANPCPPAEQVWVSTSEVATLADFGITPTEIVFVVGWGFGVVLMGFLLGWGLGLALGLIRKV